MGNSRLRLRQHLRHVGQGILGETYGTSSGGFVFNNFKDSTNTYVWPVLGGQ